MKSLDIVILGLSITSSWGNGHATTYRGLVRELAARGHHVLFLERETPWYAAARDLPDPPYGETCLYESVGELEKRFTAPVRSADLVIVGSYVPDGVQVGEWVVRSARGVTAFYDIDTPVTLALLQQRKNLYLSPRLIRKYDLYLSFTGGPTLQRLEREYGSPRARPLYCSVDPQAYFPEARRPRWDLGYMGTYSSDRQPVLERLLIETARRRPETRLVVAGAQYPSALRWPSNVHRIEHLPPVAHRKFYAEQRATLNITRAQMIRAGYSPSIRLFEAAACGCPIISDYWEGLDQFFVPGEEILLARCTDDVLDYLFNFPRSKLDFIAQKARRRALGAHTAAHRALELERYALELLSGKHANNRIGAESSASAPTNRA